MGSILWAGAVAVGLARPLGAHPGLVDVLHFVGALAVVAARIFTRITDPRTQRRLRVGSGAAIAAVGVVILVEALT
ncbi:hypothetical protein [Mycolicibacterium sp. A43C]